MSHAYAISMTRPHETLGLRMPFARRIPRGISAWNAILFTLTVALALTYVVTVNTSSSKSYALRDVEKRVAALKDETMTLESKMVTQSSLQELSDRATALGFVPVDHVDFVNVAPKAFAMR